ncbi:MAG: hypothetical protein ACYS6K_25250 [Planctomycetota bacterium]
MIDTRNWTQEGVGVLSIWYQGDSSNANEPMYVVLNGTAVVTNNNPDAAQLDYRPSGLCRPGREPCKCQYDYSWLRQQG